MNIILKNIRDIQRKNRSDGDNIKNRNYSKLKKEDIEFRMECASDIDGLPDAIEHFFDGDGDLNNLVIKFPIYFGDHGDININDLCFVAEPNRLSTDYLNRHKDEYHFPQYFKNIDGEMNPELLTKVYHTIWRQIFLDIGDKSMASKIKCKHL